MKIQFSTAACFLGTLLIAGPVLADCPGPFLHEMKRSYTSAQTYDSLGKQEAALRMYAQSQEDVCEGANPYVADAAKRAAALGLALGGAAEKKGDWQRAFELYEAGGHYALADRALVAVTRSKPDDIGAYRAARGHFNVRSEGYFVSNHAPALKAAGMYQRDAKLIAELATMPPKGIERAAQREAAAFSEAYLRDYVQLMQMRPDDLTDMGAMQKLGSAQQAFVQKWPQEDPLKASREDLRAIREWGQASGDERLAKQSEAQVRQRADQHAQVIAQKYNGAPKLLEQAIEFVEIQNLETAQSSSRIAGLKAQAGRLGDEAVAKKRLGLAADYYEVAGLEQKADAARGQQQQLAQQKMQPSIDEMRKQAEEMQKQFSDPSKVKAMKEQAEAARKSIQQQQASTKGANKKRADDLEKELGL